MNQRLWLITPFVLLFLTACATGTRLKPLESRDAAKAPAVQPAEGVFYRVLPDQSWLKVLVFRSGALANLGHNHVLRFVGLDGEVVAPVDGQHHGWAAIAVDVDKVVIDNPDDRSQAGERFSTVPSEKDIAGTRGNLLGPKVLGAEQHPQIRLEIQGMAPVADGEPVRVTVSLGELVRELTVPVKIELGEGRLAATARFALSQTDLGMTPFSVLGGALSVADVLELELRLIAERAADTN